MTIRVLFVSDLHPFLELKKSNILLVTFITLENYPLIHKLLQGRDRIRVGKPRHIR